MMETISRTALILLVEDDKSMLDGMCDLFQAPSLLRAVGIDYDIEIATANNGQEALDFLAHNTPDLIVSDIMMPIMDGYQFLKAVQKNPAWIHIPFIFLTAKGNKKEVLEGHIRGANLYITKPFASTELLDLIRSQLDRSFQRQSYHQQHVDDLKKGILQILNHEFRTPLTYVTAYYEMMVDNLQHLSNQEDFQDYLRGIQAGCIRLTKLVEDFILVIELRTGEFLTKFKQNAKPITNINELVNETIQKHEGLAKQRRVRIHFAPASNLLAVFGNAWCLQNVFDQLLNNAIKFTPLSTGEEKHIYITTAVHANEIHITFQDEGIGFPPNLENQIFDLFFQYNRGMMEQQGAGTGLTIAKGLLDFHHGRIEVKSKENEGSTFTVILPAFADTPPQLLDKTDLIPKPREATVLVVEDEHNLLIGLKELLEISDDPFHLNVLTASNGQHGLEVLSEHQPDLIISDIMMPIMDGYDFLHNVRKNPNWVQIPFIFLTAKGEHEDIHKGLSRGAEIYITKPYESDELLQLVAVQLERHFELQSVMTQSFDDLKRSILNLITPDFRLPLSDVHTYSESISDGLTRVQNDAELKKSLQGIQEGSIQLTSLIEDFISLAELRTGEAEAAYALRKHVIQNPEILFCEAIPAYTSIAEALGITLHCDVMPDLPPVYGDDITLLDALHRLVKTSIHLCPTMDEQVISLSASQEEDSIVLKIDLPMELQEDTLENINRHLTSDNLNQSDLPKFAPDLSIAQSYIQLNNGRIAIQQHPVTNHHHILIFLPIHTSPHASITI